MATSSANDCFPITPDDDNDLALETRAIAFGTAGALKVITAKGNTRTIPSGVLAAGIMHPLMVKRVLASGTTAENIWGFE